MSNSASPVVIRAATPADADLIADFNQRIAQETESRALDDAILLRGVRAVLENEALGRYFLAGTDGRVVGQLMVTFEWSDWRNGMFWWIQSVYVHADYRRRGVFASLYRHVESVARAQPGVCGLRLYVENENERALATYQRLGMIRTTYGVCEADWSNAVRGL